MKTHASKTATEVKVLPIIVISQFCCTSLWFAGNGVLNDLIKYFYLPSDSIGVLTSSVQLGFILGTLAFALLTITDRFSPSHVFMVCALLGSLFNLAIVWDGNQLASILVLRFVSGFCLAGIYPVGMKIAADYYEKGLGLSLGYLVGALVVGTAFPHFLKGFTASVSWKYVIISTSFLAMLGGVLMWSFIGNGPYRKSSQQFNYKILFTIFKNKNFRSAAFGYFGHMWELYAFWAFVPIILKEYMETHHYSYNTSIFSFIIIAVGGIACVLSGTFSLKIGTQKTAFIALLASGICCALAPFALSQNSFFLLFLFLLFWGMVVVADSPMFSTLVAQNAPVETRGTALTIVNGIGFSITILSIQLLDFLHRSLGSTAIYLLLVVGPVFGLISFKKHDRKQSY